MDEVYEDTSKKGSTKRKRGTKITQSFAKNVPKKAKCSKGVPANKEQVIFEGGEGGEDETPLPKQKEVPTP